MRGILLLNGEPYDGKIDASNAYVVCCDGAYEWAKYKVKIDENVGDFDSLSYTPDPPPEKIYPSEKDFTDGEIALSRLIGAGVNEIEIYGGGGGREDHFLGNLHLLYAADARGVAAKMITRYSEIYLGKGRVCLDGMRGVTFSVLPFGGALHIMESTGLKYAEPPEIGYGRCVGISNVVKEDEAGLTVADGDLALIIVNRGKL